VFSLDVITLLAVATLGLLVGRTVRLPPIVAYLVAGVLVGPGGIGLVTSSPALEQLAELGVALLLFGVGIEFSLERLRRILPRMLTTGALQLGGTIAATAAVLHWLGTPWPQAVFVGFLVSLSSTAIVFKLYDEDGEIDAPQGLAAAAILLFQDLALVPMMLLVPVLAHPGEGALLAASRALLAAAFAVASLLFLARTVLPRALEALVRAHVPELFPLAALVIAFGTAFGANALGLSLPLGAFLAGLALSGSRYAQQVFAELLPLRDAFVAIFFTSIGVLFQPTVALAEPALLASMVGAVVAKGVLIGVIVGLLWRSLRLAVLVGMGLAQIGEFSFVLAREGIGAGIVSAQLEQAFLGAAVLTMGLTPFLVRAARRLALLGAATPRGAGPEELRDHVLLIGYGTTGQAVARVLRGTGIPFVGVDLASENVDAARRETLPIHFGDATRRAVLRELGVERARAIVVAVSDAIATRRIVSLVRQSTATARILVRVRRVGEIAELERLGADEVVPSEFEVSIELFVRLLAHLGVPRHVARVQESIIRLGHYQALRGVGTTPELLAETGRLIMGGILETAQVMKGSAACGRTLAQLDLRRSTGATVLSIVREGEPLPSPDGTTTLEAGDLIVLFGAHEAIDRAFHLFDPAGEPNREPAEEPVG
jgi:CPA2 family monovalent cation:H+ antiporter-2